MLASRLIFVTCFCAVLTDFGTAHSDAQGFFRRLRERISNATRPQLDNSAIQNRLPARPLEPANRSSVQNLPGSNVPENNPAAQYQRPGSSGPSILSPSGLVDSDIDEIDASIGIEAIAANPGYPAVEVTQILAHSLAEEAGLRVGDYIFAIDGVPTPSVAALAGQVSAREAGETVRLRIGRGGRVSDLDVPLAVSPDADRVPSLNPPQNQILRPAPGLPAESPPSANLPSATLENNRSDAAPPLAAETIKRSLGLRVVNQPGRRGVVVQDVRQPSIAATAGIKSGDRIVAFNGKLVSDVATLGRWAANAPDNQPARLRLTRENRLVDVVLPQLTSNDAAATDGAATDPPVTDAKAIPQPNQNPQSPGSLTEGLGAVFGGLFNPSGSPDSPDSANESTLPAPTNAEPVDVLALETPMEPQNRKPSETTNSVEPVNAEIRAEVERLRAKLEVLESQLEEGGGG